MRRWFGRVCVVPPLASLVSAQNPKLHFYRVDDNVYRGPQPHRSEMPDLAKIGIRTVLDLRPTLDHKRWERAAVEAAGMRYIRIGLSPVFAPSAKQMDKIMALLTDRTLGPVYVHCRRGADRTGVVVACYRITQYHWTNAQALQAARQDGLRPIEILFKRYIEHYPAAATPTESALR
jgi:tyrosine-protein phosphatase SIW14